MPVLDPDDRSDLMTRALAAQIGGCNCDTKTPEVRYHAGDCHFRVISEMELEIRRLRLDAGRWQKFSRMTCGEQRWMCACADKDYSVGATSLEELIDAVPTADGEGK